MSAKTVLAADINARELWSAVRAGTRIPGDKLRDPDVQDVSFSSFATINDGAVTALVDGKTRRPFVHRASLSKYVCLWFVKGDKIPILYAGLIRHVRNLAVVVAGGADLLAELRRPAGHSLVSTSLFVEAEKLVDSYGLDVAGLPEHCQNVFRGVPNSRFDLDLVLSAKSWMVIDAVRHCQMTEPLRSVYLKAKCEELICETVDQLNRFGKAGIREVISRSAREHQLIQTAAQIYRKDVANSPSVDQLARRLGLNRNKLNDGFRELFGISPGQYAKRVRLEWAKEQLASGAFAIGEISDTMGYSSPSAFSRAYLEYFGNPPSIDCKAG